MNEVTPAPAKSLTTQESPFGWLRSEIDRLFDDFGQPARGLFHFGGTGFGPVPAVQLTEKDKEYRLTAELPGLKEEDIEVSVADGMITISGEKREEEKREEDGLLLNERRYGSFERRIALPSDVDANAISADIKKGVLTIVLPKDADGSPRSRKIEISTQA